MKNIKNSGKIFLRGEAMKFSILVPVYNVEKYIKRCIDSLKKQTLEDIEIILVDDGSTDGSSQVIRELLPKASFPYTLIEKENGGAGSARNAGLRAATAQWISFIDSDDGLHPEFLEYFYMLLKSILKNQSLKLC